MKEVETAINHTTWILNISASVLLKPQI